MGLIIWRSAFILLILAVGWQALSLNLANYYTGKAQRGELEALSAALWWDEHPYALAMRGRRALSDEDTGNDTRGLADLQRSLQLAPTGAWQLANLAQWYVAQSDGASQRNAEATALAKVADRLEPTNWRTQRALFLVQSALGNDAAAIDHLARALVGNSALSREYYPLLLAAAANPQARALLQPITEDPSRFRWWNGFFSYVARETETAEPLRALVELRKQSTTLPLQAFERQQYVSRLRRDGLIKEAYVTWVNGLAPQQLEALGYLYDGGFEQPLDNEPGFGWNARPPRNSDIRITRGRTFGVTGESGLRLFFSGKRVRFNHLWQHLFLNPGRYVLSGRVRPDQLRARNGLHWRLYCSSGEGGTLGESELFSGTGDWRTFKLEVEVPASCREQTLRLYSVGNRVVDHEVSGTVWFDDLRIELQR